MQFGYIEKKAEELLKRGVTLLLNALTFGIKGSDWRFDTSESAAGGVSVFKAIGVSGSGGNIYLWQEPPNTNLTWETATKRAHLAYVVGGVSVGVPIPYDPVSASYSSAGWPNAGRLLIMPGQKDFVSADDFNVPEIRSSPCMIVQVDVALLPLRWLLGATPGGGLAYALPKSDILDRQIAGSAALMFLGVNPMLQALIRSLAENFKALANVIVHKPPTGAWAMVKDIAERPFEAGWDIAKIETEIFLLTSQIQSFAANSRAVLATAGVEAGLPGAGITFYFGGVHSWDNKSSETPDKIPYLDNLPKPFTTGG